MDFDFTSFVLGTALGAGICYFLQKNQGNNITEKSNNDELLTLKAKLNSQSDYETIKQKRIDAENALDKAEKELRAYKHNNQKENRVQRDLEEEIEELNKKNSDLIDANRKLSDEKEEIELLLKQQKRDIFNLEDKIKDLEKV